jgi:hypothetical protein
LLLSASVVAGVVLSAIGQVYTGLVAAAVLAVGGVVISAIADRGRAHLSRGASPHAAADLVYTRRVFRIADPVALGVHPSKTFERIDGGLDRLPPFVERDQLAAVVAAVAKGGFVLIVGDSTAGKTRLAYEAMRLARPKSVCIKPEVAAALPSAIEAASRRRASVLWLDDLERYLGVGGLTHAHLTTLLERRKQPTLVLATIRAHERADLSTRHDRHREHTDRQTARIGREVLQAVTTEIQLPRRWSEREIQLAQQLSTDPRIAQALHNADRHGLAEYMAAGPQLLQELHDARSSSGARTRDRWSGGPRGAAVVLTAIDARRGGFHRPLPADFLRGVHELYLQDDPAATARHESWEDALAWATQPLHATTSLLEPAEGGYLAFDYLVDAFAQDETAPPIPADIWPALIDHAEPDEAVEVAWKASFAGHPEQARHTFDRAMAAKAYVAAADLANCVGDAGSQEEAADLLERTIAAAEASTTVSAQDMLFIRSSLAWAVGEQVAGLGDPERALAIAERVAADSAEVLGPDHPDTLQSRIGVARQLGATGAHDAALALATQVMADATRLLGADHNVTLAARFETAVWTGRVHGPAAGAQRHRELLEFAESLEAVDFTLILDCLWNVGGLLVAADDPDSALPFLVAAVAEGRRIYGNEHSRTLHFRLTHLQAVGAAGSPDHAVALAEELAHDCTLVLGAQNVVTLAARQRAAFWLGRTGNTADAIEQYRALRTQVEEHLPHDHWLAQTCRDQLTALQSPAANNDVTSV